MNQQATVYKSRIILKVQSEPTQKNHQNPVSDKGEAICKEAKSTQFFLLTKSEKINKSAAKLCSTDGCEFNKVQKLFRSQLCTKQIPIFFFQNFLILARGVFSSTSVYTQFGKAKETCPIHSSYFSCIYPVCTKPKTIQFEQKPPTKIRLSVHIQPFSKFQVWDLGTSLFSIDVPSKFIRA